MISYRATLAKHLRFDPEEELFPSEIVMTLTASDGTAWPVVVLDVSPDGAINTPKIRFTRPAPDEESDELQVEPPPIPPLPEDLVLLRRMYAAVRAEICRAIALWDVEEMPPLLVLPAGDPRGYRKGQVITSTKNLWFFGNRIDGHEPDIQQGDRLKIVAFHVDGCERTRPIPKTWDISLDTDGVIVQVLEQGNAEVSIVFGLVCPRTEA